MGAGEAVSKPPGGLILYIAVHQCCYEQPGRGRRQQELAGHTHFLRNGLALGSGGGGNLSNATQSSSARSISRLPRTEWEAEVGED